MTPMPTSTDLQWIDGPLCRFILVGDAPIRCRVGDFLGTRQPYTTSITQISVSERVQHPRKWPILSKPDFGWPVAPVISGLKFASLPLATHTHELCTQADQFELTAYAYRWHLISWSGFEKGRHKSLRNLKTACRVGLTNLWIAK
ncbi:hypothetical protein Hypma_011231 [Hypsizygus marmoreus]|uniref:Uncharacterized protein n=1 Tax=Hypsizygus marmoreus TaxID=39966 RepID=A0A369JQQ3_HYPMA|nr:hypothetical protein Hypma_011231 [Hypsizygus marmoreus]